MKGRNWCLTSDRLSILSSLYTCGIHREGLTQELAPENHRSSCWAVDQNRTTQSGGVSPPSQSLCSYHPTAGIFFYFQEGEKLGNPKSHLVLFFSAFLGGEGSFLRLGTRHIQNKQILRENHMERVLALGSLSIAFRNPIWKDFYIC